MSEFFELPVIPFRGEVAIIAPSSPFNRQHFNAGITQLKLNKIKPVIPKNAFLKTGYLAGSDEDRASLLIEALLSDSLKAIWAARGGYGAIRLLPLLEKQSEEIKKHPKFLIGFSDITILHSFLIEKCGFVTVHGPNITTLSTCDNYSKKQVFQLIQGEEKALTLFNPRLQTAVAGKAEGMVKGGNLASIISLIGTPYQPDFNDSILFLEEVGEQPYKVDRMLTQMRLAGMFNGVKGVVLGEFSYKEFRPPATKQIYIRQIMDNMGLSNNVPVVYNFAAGHGTKNMAFLLGAEAVLDTEKRSLSYL